MAELTERRTYHTGVRNGRALLPEAPAVWSYSSLREVEACPRRYALSRADFPDLWDRYGYPRLPIPAAIRGDVVHGALEIILKAFAKAGCSSTRSAEAVTVLRELGGYTAVAEGVLAVQLARFAGNPRISSDRVDQLARALSNWVPEAREQIQTYLNRMELRPRAAKSVPDRKAAADDSPTRHPASVGEHPEKELVADGLRLKGRIDLLSVGSGGAAITDFKTGAEDAAHHDQLRLYALLWFADELVNPDGLEVSALVASYPGRDVSVPVPDAGELDQLRSAISGRIDAADSALAVDVPVALVADHCAMCDVRGLCDEYWTRGAPKTADVADGAWYDLQGVVVREHGVKSWVLREARTGHEVLVRTPNPSFTMPVGQEIRVLGAKRTIDPDEEDALIAVLTSASEVLAVTN